MSIESAAKGFVLASDFVNALDSLFNSRGACREQCSEEKKIYIASSVNRLGIICLRASECLGSRFQLKFSKLKWIKINELVLRMNEIPLRYLSEKKKGTEGLKLYEKGIAAPVCDVIRVCAESMIYQEKDRIQNAENQAKQKGDDPHVQKEIKASREKIENYNRFIRVGLTGRVLAETDALSETAKKLYAHLFSFFRGSESQPELSGSLPRNFLAFEEIPEPLEKDCIFSRYTCAINLTPVRDPVGDPNGVTLYERKAILAWLRNHRYQSPATRKRLLPGQLVQKPHLKKLIESRLKWHEERFWKYLEETAQQQDLLNTPGDPDLQAKTDQENPRN